MLLIPIRTVSALNAREVWQAKAARTAKERKAAAKALATAPRVMPPCTVLITRVSPGIGCDDDNLAGAMKAIRDEIAVWLKVDDRKSQQVRYRYAQKRGEWGVQVEFGPPPKGAQLTLLELADEQEENF